MSIPIQTTSRPFRLPEPLDTHYRGLDYETIREQQAAVQESIVTNERDLLQAAMTDPEGRALVQAIHERKKRADA